MNYLLTALLAMAACNSFAFSWRDLWQTPDQQAAVLMNNQQFEQAKHLFHQPDWQATAAYRAGDYRNAAQQFASLHSEQGYYNQGNALAQLGNYEQAINAYDQALRLNPHNQDAKTNRQLVAELLKKQQEQQNKQDKQDRKDKQNKDEQKDNQQQNKQEQNNKSQQDQQASDNKQQDNQGNQQQNKSSANADQQNGHEKKQNGDHGTDQQNSAQDNIQDKQAEQQDNSTADKSQAEQQPAKNKPTNQANKPQTGKMPSSADSEKQQAKEQWLKLVPDDPGGLMKEKFLRDYIRRQRGWTQ